MVYNTILKQVDAANIMLTQLNAMFRLTLEKNDSKHLTIKADWVPEFKHRGREQSILSEAAHREASEFLNGFNYSLTLQLIYILPTNASAN